MMWSTENIDKLIIGRIDPHIYAFSTNTIPNYLKVGDTYRPVQIRLDEWRTIFPELEHDDNWEWPAKTQNGKYFRDFAVHYYLEQIKQFHRLQPKDIPNLPYYSREFFQNASPKDICFSSFTSSFGASASSEWIYANSASFTCFDSVGLS